jgi:hypothetical protein
MQFVILQDNEPKAIVPSYNHALMLLHRLQGQSWDYAFKYGGWRIVKNKKRDDSLWPMYDQPDSTGSVIAVTASYKLLQMKGYNVDRLDLSDEQLTQLAIRINDAVEESNLMDSIIDEFIEEQFPELYYDE